MPQRRIGYLWRFLPREDEDTSPRERVCDSRAEPARRFSPRASSALSRLTRGIASRLHLSQRIGKATGTVLELRASALLRRGG
ncbi:hypothetical protein P376_1281 [Streptomyces sp. HCCB10043]|nr:hypothetical protein P376_1281 [Streptomyces sp. HCCB10043]